MIHIRRAVPDDLPTLLAMQRAINALHRAWDAERFTTVGEAEEVVYRTALAGSVESPRSDTLFLMAESAGVAAGYLFAQDVAESALYWSPRCLYVHDIYVEPSERGAGVGRRLMEEASGWARGRGLTQARAMTAWGNEAAREFFAGFGLRPCVAELVGRL